MKLFLSIFLLATTLTAEYGAALLIGNTDIKNHPLSSGNQLQAAKKKLEDAGFSAKLILNRTQKELLKEIESWTNSIAVNSLVVIYYHGYMISGQEKGEKDNYLLLKEHNYKDQNEVERRGLGLTKLVNYISNTPASKVNIIMNCPEYPEKLGIGDVPFPTIPDISISKNFNLVSKVNPQLRGEIGSGKKAGEEWINDIGMVFCWIPAGEFTMGNKEYEDAEPVKAIIEKGFWMSKYEVTHQQYMILRNRTRKGSIATHPNHPQDCITWDESKTLLKYLKEKAAVRSGWEYAVPSEKEWEYAARAGTQSKYFFGSSDKNLNQYANFADKTLYDTQDSYYGNSHPDLNDNHEKLARVGSFKANAWGLHDMYGNVWEWTVDKYLTSYKAEYNSKKDKDSGIVVRGGGWCSQIDYCNSSFRNSFLSRSERNFLGLRLIIRKK